MAHFIPTLGFGEGALVDAVKLGTFHAVISVHLSCGHRVGVLS
jgi:hypothetical protein